MRNLAILTFMTLDGVMQAPGVPEEDFSGGFTQGGWARDCWDDVMAQVGREAMAEPYDLLLGRTTYEIFVSAFANSDNNNPIAVKLNKAKKFFVTSTLKDLQWQNSERITGDVYAEVSRLKEQDGPLLQVHGSWQLIQTLLTHRLIDEFRLWTFPVIVSAGKRLFADGAVPTPKTNQIRTLRFWRIHEFLSTSLRGCHITNRWSRPRENRGFTQGPCRLVAD